MAISCPKCGEGILKKGQKMVYCTEYKPKKNEKGKWVNEGECDFHIAYKQKLLKRALKQDEIKKIVAGEVIEIDSARVSLDVNNPFFIKIEFLNKEDEDL